jgi:hypothetical protein
MRSLLVYALRLTARVCRRLARLASAVLCSPRYRDATQQLWGEWLTSDQSSRRRSTDTSVPAGNRATIRAVALGWFRQFTLLVIVVALAVPDIKPATITRHLKTPRITTPVNPQDLRHPNNPNHDLDGHPSA